VPEVHSSADTQGNEREALEELRGVNRRRHRYSDEWVNFIREGYLLDGKTREDILASLPYPCSVNMVWRIAVGRAYQEVPLSPRLRAALEQRRRAGGAGAARPAAPEPERAPAEPVAAEELLSEESAAEDWA